jgi:hypothetical protein
MKHVARSDRLGSSTSTGTSVCAANATASVTVEKTKGKPTSLNAASPAAIVASATASRPPLKSSITPSPSSATSGQTPISRSNAWPTVGTIATAATTSTPPGTRQPLRSSCAAPAANAPAKTSPTNSWYVPRAPGLTETTVALAVAAAVIAPKYQRMCGGS